MCVRVFHLCSVHWHGCCNYAATTLVHASQYLSFTSKELFLSLWLSLSLSHLFYISYHFSPHIYIYILSSVSIVFRWFNLTLVIRFFAGFLWCAKFKWTKPYHAMPCHTINAYMSNIQLLFLSLEFISRSMHLHRICNICSSNGMLLTVTRQPANANVVCYTVLKKRCAHENQKEIGRTHQLS